jgi:predicted RNA polymerase sigma factor
LLARLGRIEEAATEFTSAAELTDNEREREVLTDKAIRMREGSKG